MQITPYLNFDGTCAEAMEAYRALFGGSLSISRFSDMPPAEGYQVDPAHADLVMHARLELPGGPALMASDAPPGRFEAAQGLWVSLNTASVEEAERLYAALSEGARRIDMPLQPTFWSPRFGMVVDRFGTPFMINCDQQPQGQ